MAPKIRLLPDTIANQIAAGEVVQRPASVVKELLENALDAGATNLKLVIQEAGKTLIQVIDNGEGMSEVDARMAFERHATSKINKAEDLFQLHTLGFRGEALASIAAVAQVTLDTRLAGQELGTHIIIEGGDLKSQNVANTPQGTQISVKNLFFNLPARRNFLKPNKVEERHILEEFQRISLAWPETAFFCYDGTKEIYHLPATKLSHRIVHLFDPSYQSQLIPCEESIDLLQLSGYIGTPQQAKKTRGGQFFFVNQRYIKSPYLHHAVKSAFEGLIPPEAHPFYALFLTMPPQHIDVNVHPTKTEIKFEEEHSVYAIIAATVKKALATHHMTPAIDFEQDINQLPTHFGAPPSQPPLTLQDRDYAQFKGHFSTNQEKSPTIFSEKPTDIAQKAPTLLSSTAATDRPAPHKLQLHQKYILTQVKSGLLLIDQRAAHERILYEQCLDRLQRAGGSTQQLLFPAKMTLSPIDFALLASSHDILHALGFRIKTMLPSAISITGLPPEVIDFDPTSLLEGILAEYAQHAEVEKITQKERWARTMARRACLRTGTILAPAEMDALVDQLFACANPNYTPDGSSIWVILPLEKVKALF